MNARMGALTQLHVFFATARRDLLFFYVVQRRVKEMSKAELEQEMYEDSIILHTLNHDSDFYVKFLEVDSFSFSVQQVMVGDRVLV